MSKNKQILIFSGVGLAVLGGVAAALMLTASKDGANELSAEEKLLGITTEQTDTTEPKEEDTVPLTLSEKQEDEVESVAITNAAGDFSITNSGKTDSDGAIVWTVADIAQAPLLTEQLRTAITGAASFTAKEFAEEVSDSSQLAKYGLDSPKAVVKAKFTDGTEFSFKVGNDVPNSTTLYYITPDDKKVYTANKSAVSSFLNGKFSFVDTKAFHDYDNSSDEEVHKMTIERVDLEEPIVIDIVPPAEDGIQVYSYRLTSPYSVYADLTDTPKFVYSLFGLTASECEWVGLGDKERETAGLDQPNCVVTVESNKKTYTLTIGKALVSTTTDENGNENKKITGFYGTSSEVPDVLYMFGADDIAAMKIMPEDIISKLFLMPYIYSLDSISLSGNGKSIDIKLETIKAETEDGEDVHNFYVDGQKLSDGQPVKDLYQYLLSASGDEIYFDEEKGELIAEIVYTYLKPTDGSDGKDVVRFYSSETDRKVIINLNGRNIFKTQQIYITQLYKNIDNFLTGRDIVLTY